eukprot:10904183-Ditylum_brightwellii.AAC.1
MIGVGHGLCGGANGWPVSWRYLVGIITSPGGHVVHLQWLCQSKQYFPLTGGGSYGAVLAMVPTGGGMNAVIKN